MFTSCQYEGALIVAQALADRTSKWLMTTDSILQDDKIVFGKIDGVEGQIKNGSLTICKCEAPRR